MRRGAPWPRSGQAKSAVAVVTVVAVVTAILLVLGWRSDDRHRGDVQQLRVAGSDAGELPTPSVSDSSPDDSSATARPSPSPTDVASVGSGGGSGTRAAAADPYCGPGPLAPGMHADAACDVGKHTGIPSAGCEVFHGCAWWDAWGATPAGPYDMPMKGSRDGTIHVSWSTTAEDLAGDQTMGPVHEFVLRLYSGTYESARLMHQYEEGLGVRSLTISGLAPGTYTVWLMELNDSGLSSGIADQVDVPAPPPSPTPSPTPSKSAPPSPDSPSPSPSAS